ncbi:MAG: hypothetical protein JSS86_22450 [Cyanobacteria bacterium SZAS LIN-2]|nr:hypothetical protein [Cyanobacteria bacterium SZAS LIN-3]MBS1999111.1 hypothetical protein [Cyanobacteria bacterium SZAS LIN-2]MBS2006041.1 hypothetical protein [Cyanobacteria bacterium SZAS TMP-1]
MKIAIIAVLLIIAYQLYSNILRIAENRAAERSRQGQRDHEWEVFYAGLNQIKEKQAQFLQRSANLPSEDRDHLWRPVQDDKIRACHFLLAHDFARAMSYLHQATSRATALVSA